MRAPVLTPPPVVTPSDVMPSTTWALVRTCPSRSTTTPEPTTVSNRRCGLALLIFTPWIDTTDGETRSKTWLGGSEHGCAAALSKQRTRASAERSAIRWPISEE